MLAQGFHSLSSIDSRLLNSLKVLFTRPGAITNAYVLGPRKPYIGQFQLKVALLAVVIAAAVPGYRFLILVVTLYTT